MTIIVEDGTIVANANAYADREAVIEYAASRGTTIADEDDTDVFIVKAMDYIEALTFKGDPITTVQPLSWPRMNLVRNDFASGAAYVVPRGIVKAMCQLALDISQGFDPSPNIAAGAAGAIVTSEKIGPLSTTYSEASASRTRPLMPIAQAALAPFLVGNGIFGLQVRKA